MFWGKNMKNFKEELLGSSTAFWDSSFSLFFSASFFEETKNGTESLFICWRMSVLLSIFVSLCTLGTLDELPVFWITGLFWEFEALHCCCSDLDTGGLFVWESKGLKFGLIGVTITLLDVCTLVLGFEMFGYMTLNCLMFLSKLWAGSWLAPIRKKT